MTFLDDLAGAVQVDTDPELLDGYRRDHAAPGLLAAGMPAALVRPRTTAEVQAVVRAAARHGVPVVPRGAGSGLSGGANAVDGCVVVCLEQMDSILDISPADMTATVQPGVINGALVRGAGEEGLWYAPDPSSAQFSTIGGNIATNAGGLCCSKYGVTRDAVLSLEVVLADGEVVRIGRRQVKGVAGYDLAALFCGSEGTLGIVTEATVRLLPPPAPMQTVVASFPKLDGAGEAIAQVTRTLRPAILELIDRAAIGAVEDIEPMELDRDAAAMVFGQSDAAPAEAAEQIAAMAAAFEQAGASLVVSSDDPGEGRTLMGARRMAHSALHKRSGSSVLEDVAVPLGAIASLLAGIEQIAAREGVEIGTFGHAADGNMHPTIVYDPDQPESVVRAGAAIAAIGALALELGGTVTGEHGVGLLKREGLATEAGTAHRLHRAVKDAFDPDGLLNPGKLV